MQKKMMSLLLAGCTAIILCGSNAGMLTANAAGGSDEHEPLTICAPGRNIKDFIDVVHETYPEINFDVVSYAGQNGTNYMMNQYLSDNVPDIYSISTYSSSKYDYSDKLIDLAGYGFTDNYVPSRLREVSEEGSIYLLPSYYNCLGITYNKKILEENGWTLPKSLKELEELVPKVEEAGYRLCLNELGFPGYGFQYLCNILDTGYFSTLDGRKWQDDFLNGYTTLQGSPEMMEEIQLLQRWRDIGMLNAEVGTLEDGSVATEMAKGNTLFLIGTTNTVGGERGGNPEDFGLMPYLSEDGDQNVYILNVSRYMGLSKKLEEPGNEQKLEDAVHVMEVLSSQEGMEALNANYVTTNISPLKDAPNVEGSYYNDIIDDINNGYTAPYIYAGWENVLTPYGEEMRDFISGKAELDDVISFIDENQSLITEEKPSITTATETISTEGCAKITGIAFAQAAGADLSLISINVWDDQNGSTNGDGVNGQIFPLPVREDEICSFIPTGWNGNIQTVTLTGKRVKELAEEGFNRKDRGFYFPYLLITKEGMEIEDGTTYTVAICGTTEALCEEGNVQDTGILGIEAVKEYLSQFETLEEKDIIWE